MEVAQSLPSMTSESPDDHWQEIRALHLMPIKMWHDGIRSYDTMLRHHCPETLEHMLVYLSDPSAMVARLMQNAPNMIEDWVEMEAALTKYRKKLQCLKLGRQLGNVPGWLACLPTSLNDHYLYLSSDASHAFINFMVGVMPSDAYSRASGETVCGDWCLHFCRSGIQHPYASHWCAPDLAINIVVGWLYYGQAITWDNFDIYRKVFTLLCFDWNKQQSWDTLGSRFQKYHPVN